MAKKKLFCVLFGCKHSEATETKGLRDEDGFSMLESKCLRCGDIYQTLHFHIRMVIKIDEETKNG